MGKKVEPIKPDEVADVKKKTIPDEVIRAFNALIVEHWNGSYATVKQDDVVALLVAKDFDRDRIYKEHWLDVEDIFRAAGWSVGYDKPAYNESYPATFTFKKKGK